MKQIQLPVNDKKRVQKILSGPIPETLADPA
jgi:hypothetical protein